MRRLVGPLLLLPASLSIPTSPYDFYQPLTALNEFGQSTQLLHALRAADSFGTPILACLSADAVVVASLSRNAESPPTMVRTLATRDSAALHSALVSTGLSADAAFLYQTVQRHILSRYWFRYDTLPTMAQITQMLQEVLLDFLPYDNDDQEEQSEMMTMGGRRSAAPSSPNGDRAGRPLGVCTFLLGWDTEGQREPSLTMVEANGSSQQYVARAMGMGSTLGNHMLAQKWTRNMPQTEIRTMLTEILKEIAQEIAINGGSGSTDCTVVCETVTSTGIDVEYLPLSGITNKVRKTEE